jgi:serine/threonine protein kinase
LLADGRIKLADFGVAQIQRVPPRFDSTGSKTLRGGGKSELEPTSELLLTRAGMMIGSPMYMAPELAEGSAHGSKQSDMFSFGLVAYEMLSGRRAYPRPLVMAMMEGLAIAEPAPLDSLTTGLADGVATLVHACLDPLPARRPAAATVQAALERA